eukprot:GHVU01189558.1.p1 GENE.GHVU01189558.1~~GHVU01189558.1.p1  ORF type:complete len:114 (-),score=9.45 GHVU01189558.1:45-386(-)
MMCPCCSLYTSVISSYAFAVRLSEFSDMRRVISLPTVCTDAFPASILSQPASHAIFCCSTSASGRPAYFTFIFAANAGGNEGGSGAKISPDIDPGGSGILPNISSKDELVGCL